MNICVENNVLEELLQLLILEKIEENIFRGQSQDLGFGSVFGGQVLGQALSAAYETMPPDRKAHSLHAYFLRMGDVTKPIVYEVDAIRDGKSFTTRRVVAIQKGLAIFSMAASFQIDEPGFDHQDRAPEVIGPEGLESELELAMKVADKIPESIREKILCKKPIELRPVNPINPFAPEKRTRLSIYGSRPSTECPTIRKYTNICWPMHLISDWWTPPFTHTGKVIGRRIYKSPAWITPCGSTGILEWTNGFCT